MPRPVSRALTLPAVLAAFLLLPACAGPSGGGGSTAASPAAVPAPVPAQAPGPAEGAAANEQAAVTPDQKADEVVCKKYMVTGSRIASRKVCKTRREWVADSQRIGDAMRASERRGSAMGAPSTMGGG